MFIENVDALVAQHHEDAGTPEDLRFTQRMVRVLGRDQSSYDWLVCDGKTVPSQPSTLGYRTDAAVWYASGEADPDGVTRNTPIWGNAFPGITTSPTGTTSDPYKSDVVTQTYAQPAFDQDPDDPTSWRADTGTLAQKVAPSGGADLPGGTQVICVPFSVQTKQQMSAFKASSELVAVWFGGSQNGKLGTLVYDVDSQGNLDKIRRARIHSFLRVVRYPKNDTQPLLDFGANPGAERKPFPISCGLAWHLGGDVDKSNATGAPQAGYGLVSDVVAGTLTPPPPPPPANPSTQEKPASPSTAMGQGGLTGRIIQGVRGPGGFAGGVILFEPTPQTQEKPQSSQPVPQTQEKIAPTFTPTPPAVVLGVSGKQGYGIMSVGEVNDKHHIGVTPDGENINAVHLNVQAPWDGDGFDAPPKTNGYYKKTSQGGPLWVDVEFVYDPNETHPFLRGPLEWVGNKKAPNTIQGIRRWEAPSFFDSPPPPNTQKPNADGGQTKPYADKGFNPSKDSDPNADKTGNPAKDSDPGADGQPQKPRGDFAIPQKEITDGQKPNEDKIRQDYGRSNKVVQDYGLDKIPGDPSGGFVPSNVIGGGGFGASNPGGSNVVGGGTGTQVEPSNVSLSFGGGILLSGGDPSVLGQPNQSSDGSILVDRSYARTPSELAVPGILARAVPSFGADYRGRTTGPLTKSQRDAYNKPSPITGVLSAVGDQAAGGYAWLDGGQPGNGQYAEGIGAAGGFAFHPSNVDIRLLQNYGTIPAKIPPTSLFIAAGASLSVADPGIAGIPINGFVQARKPSANNVLQVLYADGLGATGGNSHQALVLDQGNQLTQAFGGNLVNGKDTSAAGQVPVSDGNGVSVTWTNQLSPCFYGNGNQGSATCDGSTAVSGMSRSGSTYTLTQDCYFVNLTVNSGVTVKLGGFRLCGSGTLTNAGTIHANGNPGAGITGGANTWSGNKTLGLGFAGANGLNAAGDGTAGAGTVPLALGGNGGNGGNAGAHLGGGGGISVPPPFATMQGSPFAMPLAAFGLCLSVTQPASNNAEGSVALAPAIGGSPGGSGALAAGATNSTSGGGGGAGGVGAIFFKTIANTGSITAAGGAGGNAVAGADGIQAGGGGGGGGGALIIGSQTFTGNAATAAGGAAGNGANGGANGTAGGSGLIINLC